MKRIGILGGMSWESTVTYYQLLNLAARNAGTGLTSAPLLLWNFDFSEIVKLQRDGKWETLGQILAEAAASIEGAGAEAIVIATNLMHKVAPAIESRISIPLLHIVDAIGEKLRDDGIRHVGLLGTLYTMEESFYRERLERNFDIETVIPPAHDREIVHNVIFGELCQGRISEHSKKEYLRIITGLKDAGAQGVILGCTEIGLLVSPSDSPLAVYDSTPIHCEYASRWSRGA